MAKINHATPAVSASPPEPEAPPSPYFCTPCTYDYERPKADRGTRPRRSRTRSASLVHISVDCTGGAASGRRSAHSDAPLLQHLLSEQVPARDVSGCTNECYVGRGDESARLSIRLVGRGSHAGVGA